MTTDVEKSFTARLVYNAGANKYGGTTLVSIDFAYIELVSNVSNVLGATSGQQFAKSKSHQYLSASTQADSPVELYFRYDSGRGTYRIWIRNGEFRGRLLANSNNGYIYANTDYSNPHLFWLFQQDENGKWKTITIDQFSYSKEFRIQQADTAKNIGIYPKQIPDSSDPSSWWAYVVTDGETDKFMLTDVITNVDYAQTDVWGAGKA